MNNAATTLTVDYAGRGSRKLADQISKLVAGAGNVVDARMYSPEEGGGWVVALDSEYAALKTFYAYRNGGAVLDKTADGRFCVSVR